MSRNTGNRHTSANNGANPMWPGILIGMVVGVSLAAGVTWYLMKSPSPFLKKELVTANPSKDTEKSVASSEAAKPGSKFSEPATEKSNDKPRFEFYKVLTDKQEAAVYTPGKRADQPKEADTKPAVAYEPHLLQAGSFSNAADAEKHKARLALLGVEANIQPATIPDKGVWYRVRLGPYSNAEELSRMSKFLKQNGVDSTPIKVQ